MHTVTHIENTGSHVNVTITGLIDPLVYPVRYFPSNIEVGSTYTQEDLELHHIAPATITSIHVMSSNVLVGIDAGYEPVHISFDDWDPYLEIGDDLPNHYVDMSKVMKAIGGRRVKGGR